MSSKSRKRSFTTGKSPNAFFFTQSSRSRLIYTVGNERDADYVPPAERGRIKKAPTKKRVKMAEQQAPEHEETYQGAVIAPPPNKERKSQAANGGPAKLLGRGRRRGIGKVQELAEDPDEHADDSGRNASKIFFKQVNVSKKRKSNAATAKIDVEQALEDFTKALEEIPLEKPENNPASHLRAHLRAQLPEKLEDVLLYGSAGEYTRARSMPSCSPLDETLAALKDISDSLHTYHALANETSIKRAAWMRWDSDHGCLIELSEHALQIVAKQLNSMVIPERMMEEKVLEGNAIEMLAWDMLNGARRDERDRQMSWGTLAKGLAKAFEDVLRLADGV